MKQSGGFARIVRDPKFLMLIILVVLNIFFALTSESYLSVENIFNMLKQSAMIIIVASAATILMMTGNFDLSTGSTLALTGVIYTLLLVSGMALWPAARIAILCGSLVGVINGALVSRIEFPPFIATLGMMYIARGLALILLSTVTSLDALAVGLSLALAGISVWYPSVVIGAVTAGLCLLVITIGQRLQTGFGRIAEMAGGVVLVLIGLGILHSHRVF